MSEFIHETRWPSCPVCAARDRAPWVAFEELAFSQCVGCGVVYKTRERLPSAPALYEGAYHTGKRSRRWAHRVNKAKRQLREALSFRECASLLDVGCSVGYVVEAGRQLGLRSVGVDLSSTAVEGARARGLDARLGSIDALPVDDGSVDLVMLRHVLEHTPTPRQALSEVRRVLTPGGVLIVIVPDVDYWKGTRQRTSYRYFRPDDLGRQHFVYYSRTTLRRLLAASGFDVLAEGKGWRSSAEGVMPRLARLAVAAAFSLAGALRLRRELFFVARRRDAP